MTLFFQRGWKEKEIKKYIHFLQQKLIKICKQIVWKVKKKN